MWGVRRASTGCMQLVKLLWHELPWSGQCLHADGNKPEGLDLHRVYQDTSAHHHNTSSHTLTCCPWLQSSLLLPLPFPQVCSTSVSAGNVMSCKLDLTPCCQCVSNIMPSDIMDLSMLRTRVECPRARIWRNTKTELLEVRPAFCFAGGSGRQLGSSGAAAPDSAAAQEGAAAALR